MAKRKFQGRYCVATIAPRYDNRDAIIGSRTDVERCYTSERKAKKAMHLLDKRIGNTDGEIHVTICHKTKTGHLNCVGPHRSRKGKVKSKYRGRRGSIPF